MRPIIVGDPTDSHVDHVLARYAELGRPAPLLVDAPSVMHGNYALTLDEVALDDVRVELVSPARGWLRRYAPSMWGAGLRAGSLEAVSLNAFLALIGSVSRLGSVEWLTPVDRMLAGEDRLYQLDVARRLGVRVPRTIVTSRATAAVAELGPTFIVKPLAGGYYLGDEGPRAVFSSQLAAQEALSLDFSAAPFVAQEVIRAKTHLRVVTVGSDAWVASLSADDRPLDWRQQEEAHSEWRPVRDIAIAQQAVQIAAALGVGYSSQDWIVDDAGATFVDLNPGGEPPRV